MTRKEALEAVAEAARKLKFGKYPAYSGGFVCIVTEGNVNELQDAIAAYDAAEPDGWRGMETAPKDEVCDYWLQWADGAANKPLGKSSWKESQRFRGKYGHWSCLFKATHWRPLPPPPAASQEGEG